jgi:hypothetical protein
MHRSKVTHNSMFLLFYLVQETYVNILAAPTYGVYISQ